MTSEASPDRPVVWLVRHGETSWNAEGRMQGHTDVPLTERGRAQAHVFASFFENFMFSFCHDMSLPFKVFF